MTQLWLVGKVKPCTPAGTWDFQGVFDSQAKALAACRASHYFYAPIVVNQELPDETTSFPGAVFPLAFAVVQ